MRILVTGGAGFIGKHLCWRLLDEGHDVICMDNFFTSSRESIAHLEKRKGFKLLIENVQHEHAWQRARDEVRAPIDQIYHLACPASPVHYQRYPLLTIQTAFLGTMFAVGFAATNRACILIASTSEVYGDPEVSPQPESYVGHVNPVGPRACYDEGKRAAEALVFAYTTQTTSGLDFRIARIFNTYGPMMATGDGRLLPNLITQGLAGEPLTITGDGSQTRSFCYVSDTVEGLCRFMNIQTAAPILNIGNPDERTILSVASDVLRCAGRSLAQPSNHDIDFWPAATDDPRRRCPDITLARKQLDWEPKVPFEEGLKRTMEWFRTRRNA